jgi:SAM-dependent methyltransferase
MSNNDRSTAPAESLEAFWQRNTAASASELTREQQAVIFHCSPTPGLKVLELGCGSAALGRELARRGCVVTAVDFTQEMIDLAAALPGGNKVEFIRADVLELHTQRQFDRIVGTSFLHEVPHAQFNALADWLTEHLAPDGRLVFVENSFFNPLFRWVRRNLVDRGLLRKVGSFEETPFDLARFTILEEHFEHVDRRIDTFNLFGRALGQFIAYRRGLGWTARLGAALDDLLNRLPAHNRLMLAWSFQQTIMASQKPLYPDAAETSRPDAVGV